MSINFQLISIILKKLVLFCLCIFFNDFAQSQNIDHNDSLTISLKSFINPTGDNLPFWLWANKRGKVEPTSSNLLFDVENITYSKKVGNFLLSTRADVSANFSAESSLNFSQIYFSVSLEDYELRAGRFFREQGLNSSDLGIGSMTISRNASAIPGIEARTKSFQKVPFTKGYLKYNLSYGNYWFDENRYIENAKLHSKFLYLQIDLKSIKLNAGLLHNVIWGGRTPDNKDLGNSFSDFFRVNFVLPAPDDFPFGGETTNTQGNTVAAYDTGIEWDHRKFNFSITRLFYLEDKSNIIFRSVWDGQWSADLKFKVPSKFKIRYDYLYTIRQDAVDEQPGGRANYYGHFIYQNGWTYRNKVIGNPFIEFDFINNTPSNNMMIVNSISTQFETSNGSNFTSVFSYKRSYGVCEDLTTTPRFACNRGSIPDGETIVLIPRNTLRNDQYQFLFRYDRKLNLLKETYLNILLAYDLNKNDTNNFGIGFGIVFKPNS